MNTTTTAAIVHTADARLTVADVVDAIRSAHAADVALSDAIDRQAVAFTIAATSAGALYFHTPATLAEVAAAVADLTPVKGDVWALPSLKTPEQVTRFAMAGLIIAAGDDVIVNGDVLPGRAIVNAVTRAKKAGLRNGDITDCIVGAESAQHAYDALVKATNAAARAKATLTGKNDDAPEAEITEDAPEAKVTTDADLTQAILNILSGWKGDGTGNADAIVARLAEVVAAPALATV